MLMNLIISDTFEWQSLHELLFEDFRNKKLATSLTDNVEVIFSFFSPFFLL